MTLPVQASLASAEVAAQQAEGHIGRLWADIQAPLAWAGMEGHHVRRLMTAVQASAQLRAEQLQASATRLRADIEASLTWAETEAKNAGRLRADFQASAQKKAQQLHASATHLKSDVRASMQKRTQCLQHMAAWMTINFPQHANRIAQHVDRVLE